MKNNLTIAVSILFLCAALLACKFNLGADDTTSGQSNAANRPVTQSNSADKNATNSIPDRKKADERETDDESATADTESNDPEEYKLEIKRTFQIGEKHDGDYQHGDYTIIRKLESGGTMGSLHLFKPREAVFILYDGEVIAGPLTTVEQIEEAYGMLSKQSATEHETRMKIIRNFPTGRNKRVRVYDSKGNIINEHDEP